MGNDSVVFMLLEDHSGCYTDYREASAKTERSVGWLCGGEVGKSLVFLTRVVQMRFSGDQL